MQGQIFAAKTDHLLLCTIFVFTDHNPPSVQLLKKGRYRFSSFEQFDFEICHIRVFKEFQKNDKTSIPSSNDFTPSSLHYPTERIDCVITMVYLTDYWKQNRLLKG